MTTLQRATAGVVPLLAAALIFGPTCGCREASSTPGSDGLPATSGQGIKIQFSDRPVPAPAFTVAGLDGRTISSADWRGKVVFVNFWATWCGPCREEIPALVALQARYRDKLLVVGLSIDERAPSDVKRFGDQYGLNYPVAIAGPEIQQAFGGISAVPSTFVINTSGAIVQRHVGVLNPVLSEHEVRALAGLPTDAQVEVVKDTGQVLLANAAYATEIPGVALSALTSAQREAALRRLNTEKCTCRCGLTLAQCRINDPTCQVSLPAAQALVKTIAGGR